MITLLSAGAVLPILSVLADVVFHHSMRVSSNENERRDALKVVRTKVTDTGECIPTSLAQLRGMWLFLHSQAGFLGQVWQEC